MSSPILVVRGRTIAVDGTLVMGVVNASVDSFSDAGLLTTTADRIRHAAMLVEAGADIVDVGGQSAITGRPETDARAERDLVEPIVAWLTRHHPEVLVSIDTYKPAVAAAALDAGAAIVNDVSGLLDVTLATMCAAHGAALVVMHTRARPKVRLQDPDHYADVVSDVVEFLDARMDAAIQAGLPREALIVDPGPDFSKTPHQSVAVLRAIDAVRSFGRPLLLALSRKDFLGAITGKPPRQRDAATMAAIAWFARTPGNIVRVHDVAAAIDVVRTVDVLAGRIELAPRALLADALRHEPPAAGA